MAIENDLALFRELAEAWRLGNVVPASSASDKIEKLLDYVDELRSALKPFAAYAEAIGSGWKDDTGPSLLFIQPDGKMEHKPGINLGDCRLAAAALASGWPK